MSTNKSLPLLALLLPFSFVLLLIAATPPKTGLNNAYLQSNLDGNGKSITNLNQLDAVGVTNRSGTPGTLVVHDGHTPPKLITLANGGANTVVHGTSPPTETAVVEADFSFTDNTTANASTSAHGLLPKLDNNSSHFLSGQGSFIAPTNIVIVSSVDIPMGAWFTNNIDTGIGPTITAAQVGSVTNMGDGIIAAHTNGTSTVTNVWRTRFSLPWDWDGGPVKLGIFMACSGTNSSAATNIVLAPRAVAVGAGDNLTNVTFGAFQRVVGNVGTNAWVQGTEAITGALTVGNSPSNSKGIVWEMQRWGGDASDTETNFNLFITQVRVYYQRNTRVDFP